jgi:PKD repeat protein
VIRKFIVPLNFRKRFVDAQNPSKGAPTVVASAYPTQGKAPLTVQFSSDNTVDPRSLKLTFDWDFGDGSAHGNTPNPVHIYESTNLEI